MMSRLLGALLVGLCLLETVSCTPTGAPWGDRRRSLLRSRGKGQCTSTNSTTINGTTLRIMPLGDSITQGYQSTDGNAYRNDLEILLLAGGNSVDMVGDFTSGTMEDNQEQGIDGATIANISTALPPALPLRPNVVLLHAGTNDMNRDLDVGNAPNRLSSLIDQIFGGCPDAAILVAQIININYTNIQPLVETYNAGVGQMVQNRVSLGQHVQIVDMENAIPLVDMADALHPNDNGYAIMAQLWYNGLVQANNQGWIGTPVNV